MDHRTEDGGELGSVLHRNIAALRERRARGERNAGFGERAAAAISRFAGSIPFVLVHAGILAVWIAWNVGLLPGATPFDPSFVILATAASVEAIFISTFILISQNRAAAEQDRRDELDLQISLLAEHEITRILRLLGAVAEHLGVPEGERPELAELKRDVAPEAVLDRIEDEKAGGSSPIRD